MMGEFRKIMKKSSSNMKKLGSSRFASGMFFYMEEKIPGKAKPRKVFYVSAPVKKQPDDDPSVSGVASVGEANRMLKKIDKGFKEFAKGSALCSGFLNKSLDHETLLLKITISKGCSESKLQKGLKALDKLYSGNKVSNLLRFSSDFHAESVIVDSLEAESTRKHRKAVKAFTREAKDKSDDEKLTHYGDRIRELRTEIDAALSRVGTASENTQSFSDPDFLDTRDCLEEAETYLRKYEQAAINAKKKSEFPGLYEEITQAQEQWLLTLSDRSDIETMKGKSTVEKGLDQAAKVPILGDAVKAGRSAKKGKKKDAASKVIDAGLKAAKKAYGVKKSKHKLKNETDAADEASQDGATFGTAGGIKKTLEAGERIHRAGKARAQLREDHKRSRAQRTQLDALKPDKDENPKEYRAWRRKKNALREERAAMEHLIEIQNSIRKKGSFDVLDGTLSVASNALEMSVAGSVAGDVVSGVRYGVKGGKMVADEATSRGRKSKRKERDHILAKNVRKKMVENARRNAEADDSGKETLFTTERVDELKLDLTEKEQKTYDEMKKIREIRQKSREGKKLSSSDRKKLAMSRNEDASKEYQVRRRIETAQAIIQAEPEMKQRMLEAIGIQAKEWSQLEEQAGLKYNEWRGAEPDEPIEGEDLNNRDVMLADILCMAIPKI